MAADLPDYMHLHNYSDPEITDSFGDATYTAQPRRSTAGESWSEYLWPWKKHRDVPDYYDTYHTDGPWWENYVRYVSMALLFFFFMQWAINRFTDGIWPSERAAAREIRRKAQEYMQSKKCERESLIDNQF